MITNVVDHRKRPYRFLKVNAVIEPTRHDNSVEDADRIEGKDSWFGYDEKEHISINDAFHWAESHHDNVTLFLYDEDGGIYPNDKHVVRPA